MQPSLKVNIPNLYDSTIETKKRMTGLNFISHNKAISFVIQKK